jgi:hypothetical protein
MLAAHKPATKELAAMITMHSEIDRLIDQHVFAGNFPLDRPAVRQLEDWAIGNATAYGFTPSEAVALVQQIIAE